MRVLFIVAAFLLLSSYAFAEITYLTDKDIAKYDADQKAKWRMLKEGMSEPQVRNILGEPEKVSFQPAVALEKYWDYPNGGRVTFGNGAVQDSGLVESWSEPQWVSQETAGPSWRSLKKGMTQEEVRQILGEPDKIENDYTDEPTWNYYGRGDVYAPSGYVKFGNIGMPWNQKKRVLVEWQEP